jgi:quinolinate synthase
MADMADEDQLEIAWRELAEMGVDVSTIVPVTYINSSAAIKAFVGSTAASSAPRRMRPR